jgi:hypothetical protein
MLCDQRPRHGHDAPEQPILRLLDQHLRPPHRCSIFRLFQIFDPHGEIKTERYAALLRPWHIYEGRLPDDALRSGSNNTLWPRLCVSVFCVQSLSCAPSGFSGVTSGASRNLRPLLSVSVFTVMEEEVGVIGGSTLSTTTGAAPGSALIALFTVSKSTFLYSSATRRLLWVIGGSDSGRRSFR